MDRLQSPGGGAHFPVLCPPAWQMQPWWINTNFSRREFFLNHSFLKQTGAFRHPMQGRGSIFIKHAGVQVSYQNEAAQSEPFSEILRIVSGSFKDCV
ncbi:MAG: hypothetical protein AAF761_10175, partial [Pseudomonadota bacterium]